MFHRRTYSTYRPRLTSWQIYGTPITNIFLYGSITYLGLHLIHAKLDFKEHKEEMEEEIKKLEKEFQEKQRQLGRYSILLSMGFIANGYYNQYQLLCE